MEKEMTIIVNGKRVDALLVFSPDDEEMSGKGWYWERFDTWQGSQLFRSESEAVSAANNDVLIWDE